jgi:hypothetical protein
MNRQNGAVAEKQPSEAEYLKLEAMAYRHGMTMEEYAIALAVCSPLPEPKTEEQMFRDLREELERLKTEGTTADSVDKAIAKLSWIELISREAKGKKPSSAKAPKGDSTAQRKTKAQ